MSLLPPSFSLIALMIEAVRFSETSVSIYQITRRNILGDSRLEYIRKYG
jgi:hypothetical protein